MKIIILISLISCFSFAGQKSEGGRFQILQISDMRRDQYMIDTQTGNLWSSTCISKENNECAYGAFMKVDVEDINIKKSAILKKASDIDKYIENGKKQNN